MKRFKLMICVVGLLGMVGCEDDSSGSDNADGNRLDESEILAAIENRARDINDELIAIRRDLHQYPEVSGEEVRTSGKIAEYLTDLGLDVRTDIGGHGVVGILKGKQGGKTVAWRADMDALQTDLPDPVDFRSTNPGVRHICGHDVHTTIALGMANVLTGLKDQLKGTMMFIFQPAEENGVGAKSMMNDGLFEIAHPDEIYGAHIFPFPVGVVSTKPEETFSYPTPFSFVLELNDVNQDIETFATELLDRLSNVEDDFWEGFGDETRGLWAPTTVYDDYLTWDRSYFFVEQSENTATIETLLLTTDPDATEAVPENLQALLQDTEYADNLKSIHVGETFGVYNDQALTDQAVEIITSVFGNEIFVPQYGQLPGFNDDFAFFQEQIPGVYFTLGGSDFQNGMISAPHTPDFVVDESSIEFGVNVFSSLIFKTLMK